MEITHSKGKQKGDVYTFYISFLITFEFNKLAGDISSYSRDTAPVQYTQHTHIYFMHMSFHHANPEGKKKIRKRERIAQRPKNHQSSKSPLLTGCKTICGKHIIPPIPPSLILLLSHSFPPNSPSASLPFHPIHRLYSTLGNLAW